MHLLVSLTRAQKPMNDQGPIEFRLLTDSKLTSQYKKDPYIYICARDNYCMQGQSCHSSYTEGNTTINSKEGTGKAINAH